MVCPLRYVLASVSLAILLIGLIFCDGVIDEELKPDWVKRIVKKDRTWFRFIISLFTGEILIDAWTSKVKEQATSAE
jgi:hypothetical protein